MMAVFNSWLAKNPETMTVDSSWAGIIWLLHTTDCMFPVVKTFLSHSSSIVSHPGGETVSVSALVVRLWLA